MKGQKINVLLVVSVTVSLFYSCHEYAKLIAVETGNILNISANSAKVDGFVIDIGETGLSEYGHCWSTKEYPTIASNRTELGSKNSPGVFESVLDNLIDNTTYYVRAYSTNSFRTVYGEQKSFTTEEILTSVTDYDGNIYNVISIGNQLWMSENLKVTHYADGTPIPLITSNIAWANLGNNDSDKAYCYYNNNANGEAGAYGALYTWAAAMNGAKASPANPSGVQGVCPIGWHLPSAAEWKELEIFLGMDQAEVEITGFRGTNEGGKLKETGTTHWSSPNTGATNETGFNALPGGFRNSSTPSAFEEIGYTGHWWSSSDFGWGSVWFRSLFYNSSQAFNNYNSKSRGQSVRCVKD